MKKWTEIDIENLIRNSVFPNPVHKKAVHEKLFKLAVKLDIDDLMSAAGGVMQPESENESHQSFCNQ